MDHHVHRLLDFVDGGVDVAQTFAQGVTKFIPKNKDNNYQSVSACAQGQSLVKPLSDIGQANSNGEVIF